MIAGTSTGGILALGLTIPKTAGAPLHTAQNFVEMYEREGPKIFSRSIWRRIIACNNLTEEKYCAAGIDAVLADYFGESRLADAATDVLVTSYEIEHSFPFFFKKAPTPASAAGFTIFRHARWPALLRRRPLILSL